MSSARRAPVFLSCFYGRRIMAGIDVTIDRGAVGTDRQRRPLMRSSMALGDSFNDDEVSLQALSFTGLVSRCIDVKRDDEIAGGFTRITTCGVKTARYRSISSCVELFLSVLTFS